MDRFAVVLVTQLLMVGTVGAATSVTWYDKTGSKVIVNNASAATVRQASVLNEAIERYAGNAARATASRGVTIGASEASLGLSRLITAGNVLRAGTLLARLAGPVGLAYAGAKLGEWLWDEVEKKWYQKNKIELGCWSSNGTTCVDVDADCAARKQNGVDSTVRVNYVSAAKAVCQGFSLAYNWWYDKFTYSKVVTGVGEEVVYPTDAQLDTAVQSAINDGSLTPDGVVSSALNHGVAVDMEPMQVSGPSSVPGPTSTKTTSSSAGQTTTTTNTTYNINYNNNTVNVGSSTVTNVTKPDGTTETQTETTGGSGSTPTDETDSSQCDKYPQSLGCQELGDSSDVDLPTQQRDVTWQQQGSAAGSCPSPQSATMGGNSYEFSWEPECQFARGIRPFVIGIAWLSAGLFLFFMARGTR
jgi:hypothetical protein